VRTAGDRADEVTLNTLYHCGTVEIRDEPIDVKTQLGGVADQVLSLQRMLTGEHEVQPRPEHPLVRCRLGRPRGDRPVGVVRQLAHHIPQVVPEVGAQIVPRTGGVCTVRALEVNVLHERELGVLRTADVIDLRIDWWLNVASTIDTSTPTVAWRPRSEVVPNASPMMSSDTVKPIPDSAAPPNTLPIPTPIGRRPSPRRTAARVMSPMPRSLPSTSPEMTPQVTGEPKASASNPPRRSTPAFAKANTGTISSAAGSRRNSCSRSFTEIPRDSPRSTAWADAALGDCQKSRNSCLAATTL
jgi:hypothetical protein